MFIYPHLLKFTHRDLSNRTTPSDFLIIETICYTPVFPEQLTQTKMEFPVGLVVNAKEITNSSLQRYQDVFYENFEWGLLGNKLKWRLMEWTQVCYFDT